MMAKTKIKRKINYVIWNQSNNTIYTMKKI